MLRNGCNSIADLSGLQFVEVELRNFFSVCGVVESSGIAARKMSMKL